MASFLICGNERVDKGAPMSSGKKTSPWVYVGVGCAVALGLVILAAVVLGVLGYQYAKQVGEDLKDPAVQEAKVKDVLGTDSLPTGYYPRLSVSIPFLMDMAILSDRERTQAEDEPHRRPFDHRAFIYMIMIGGEKQRREQKDFFEGRSRNPNIFGQQGFNVRSGDLIRRGAVDVGDVRVLYVAERGSVDFNNDQAEGVTALLMPECPNQSRNRIGIWFGPDPDPTASVQTADFTGSPADEAALRAFLGHFDLCRKE